MPLTHQLITLEAAGLIRLAPNLPEVEYLFRHALLQDSAYGSLLKADRKHLHAVVGEVLEQLYDDHLAELAPVLAHHFALGGDETRALGYYAEAGASATQHHAIPEAVAHYTHAVALARKTNSPQLGELSLKLGRALEVNSQHTTALQIYTELTAFARERGERAVELSALVAHATLYATPSSVHNPSHAQELAEQALALARDLNDAAAQAKVFWVLSWLNLIQNHMNQGAQYGEQSLAITREFHLTEQRAFTLNDLGRVYVYLGRMAEGQAALTEAAQLWRDFNNLPMLADNLTARAYTHFLVAEYDDALHISDEAYAVSVSTGNVWSQASCRLNLSYIYFEQGDLARAIEMMNDLIATGSAVGYPGAPLTQLDLGWMLAWLGSPEQGLALARESYATAEKFSFARLWLLAVWARILILNQRLPEAEEVVEKARAIYSPEGPLLISILFPFAECELALAQGEAARALTLTSDFIQYLQRVGKHFFLPQALYLKSRAELALHQSEAAHATLHTVRALAEAHGSRRMQWLALSALSQIARDHGEAEATRALSEQARSHLEYLAAHCPTPDLRESLLNLPEARAVLEAV